jgi:hypothetical protein
MSRCLRQACDIRKPYLFARASFYYLCRLRAQVGSVSSPPWKAIRLTHPGLQPKSSQLGA